MRCIHYRPMKSICFLTGCIVFFAFFPLRSAHAFTLDGHNIIESIAYTTMQSQDFEVHGEDLKGIEILNHLIVEGYLKSPAASGAMQGSPYLGSGRADLIFSRQFSSNGQCFHFMAQTDDSFSERGEFDVPVNYSGEAVQRCISLITTLTQEIFQEKSQGGGNYQNVYAVIHMVADSYSDAHSSRTGQGIQYLRPWRLTTFFPYIYKQVYLLQPSVWWDFANNHHAAFVEGRDDQFVTSESGFREDCEEAPNPYFWEDENCLSPRAREAAETVISYLKTVYEIDRLPGREKDITGSGTDEAKIWMEFLETNFQPAAKSVEIPATGLEDPEWVPVLNLGFRTRLDEAGNQESALIAEWYYATDKLLPFQLGFSLEGTGEDREGNFYSSVDPVLLRVSLSENVALGIRPYTIHRLQGRRLTSSSAHLDLYFWDRMWVQLQMPRYVHQNRVGEDRSILRDKYSVAIGIGIALGGEAPDREGPPKLLSPWKKSDFDNRESYFEFSLEPYFIFNPSRRRSGYGAETVLTRMHWGRRESWRFAMGIGFSNDTSAGTEFDSGPPDKLDFWLSTGYFIVSDWVYLGLTPYLFLARGEGGILGNEDEKAEQAGAEGKLYVFEKLVISLYVPLYSYTQPSDFELREYTLKIGISF